MYFDNVAFDFVTYHFVVIPFVIQSVQFYAMFCKDFDHYILYKSFSFLLHHSCLLLVHRCVECDKILRRGENAGVCVGMLHPQQFAGQLNLSTGI